MEYAFPLSADLEWGQFEAEVETGLHCYHREVAVEYVHVVRFSSGHKFFFEDKAVAIRFPDQS